MTYKQVVRKTIFIMIMIFSHVSFAMSMSEPIYIGGFGATGAYGGFVFSGENENIIFEKKVAKSRTVYAGDCWGRGIANWGNGNQKLYCRWNTDFQGKCNTADNSGCWLSGENKNYGVAFPAYTTGVSIKVIPNDTGIKFYLCEYLINGKMVCSRYVLLGVRQDGIAMKYFDTEDVLQNMFGINEYSNGYTRPVCKDDSVIVTDNKVIIPLIHTSYDSLSRKHQFTTSNLVFTWDESKRWFGVANIN